MALSYDQRKKSYESLDDSKKQQYNDLLKSKGDDYIGNQYMKQYNGASQTQQTNNNTQSGVNSSNFNNQNGTNGQKQTQQQPIQQTANGDTRQNPNGVEKTITQEEMQNSINEAQAKMKNQNNVSPDLDQTKFNEAPGKITVQEGTAQVTGRPDYQANSEARLNEMKGNLDQYFKDSPWMFQDRETFNRVFEYDKRDSEAQRQLLDSYWKRKQDIDKASQYNTGDSIANGMKDAEITTDQLNYIKEYSPEAYREWMQKQLDDINLRIANLATPADPTDNAELFANLAKQLNLEPGDPYQIYDNWYNTCERLGVFKDSEKLASYQNQLDQNHSKMESIISRYTANTGGAVSDALAGARLQKALAPYQQREVDLQNSYTTLLNGRNSNLAVANQSATALSMQAAEDQRIFNQRLAGLGFAMKTAEFRTYEQKAQTDLYKSQALNSMELLQQAQLKDIDRYDAYATAKMKNQLQNEMFDLSVTDPTELRNNLNNVLSQYYDEYGMMIQRSQQQAVDDILKYAKDNNVSVAEALSQNFIKPLQEKPQYKSALNQKTGYDPYSNQQQWQYVMDEAGNVSLKVSGYGEIPESAFSSRSSRQNAYEDVYNYTGGNRVDYVQCLSDSIKDGSYGGQCGAFVNDVLMAGGADKIFGDSLKQKIDSCNSDTPQVGYAVVFDFQKSSSDGVNHGHVGIVTKVNSDGSLEVLESNYNGKREIRTQTYSANTVKRAVKGYYRPENYSTQMTMQPRQNSTSTQNGSIVTNQRGSYDKQYESYFRKWLTGDEGAKLTDKDKEYIRNKLGSSFDGQLYAYQMEQESKGSQNALNVLKTIQEFENLGGTNRGWGKLGAWGTAMFDEAEYNKFKQLQKQLQLQELFNAKANGATFGAMSESEWDILGDAATSLKRSQNWGFNAELENIKQALRSAAFGNNNYTKENRQAWKDANPLASQSVTTSTTTNSSQLSTPLTTSTLFRQNNGYNMSFISNK